MSWQALKAVMEHSRTKGMDRMIMLVIATHADKDTFSCFPSREQLAAEANMSERNLVRCLESLEKTGEIAIKRGNGRGNLTTYTIILPSRKDDNMSSSFTGEKRVTEKGDKSERVTKKGDSMLTPFDGIEPERVTEKGDNMSSPFTSRKGDKPACAYKDIELNIGTLGINISTDAFASADESAPESAPEILDAEAPIPEDSPAPRNAAQHRPPVPEFEIFAAEFLASYQMPYAGKKADFVQLAALKKTCVKKSWELTEGRFRQAVANYFASELGAHTFADLCVRFSTFYRSRLDRYGRPAQAGNGSSAQSNLAKQLDEASNGAYRILFGEDRNQQPFIEAEVIQ